jgi:hypothetical protein
MTLLVDIFAWIGIVGIATLSMIGLVCATRHVTEWALDWSK